MRTDPPNRVTTLKKVAEEAGVSISVVSKVLHGRGASVRVSEETAEHVRATAKKMRYVPNGLARSLRMTRTHTVGLVFENFGRIASGPLFYVYLLDGVSEELFRRHYRLTILPEVDHGAPLASISDGRLDGVIWCKLPAGSESLAQLADSNIPIIALNAPPDGRPAGLPCIVADNAGGSELVVEHLTSLGHERIVFVQEHLEECTPDSLARLEGFRRAMQARNLTVDDDQVVTWSNDASELIDWLRRPSGTALYAWNEAMGASILAQARQLGVKVPAEFSVVGFDSTQFCESTLPRLTAVCQPIREMAVCAASTLLDLIEGQRPRAEDRRFPCTLDVRDSTAPPPGVQPTQR